MRLVIFRLVEHSYVSSPFAGRWSESRVSEYKVRPKTRRSERSGVIRGAKIRTTMRFFLGFWVSSWKLGKLDFDNLSSCQDQQALKVCRWCHVKLLWRGIEKGTFAYLSSFLFSFSKMTLPWFARDGVVWYHECDLSTQYFLERKENRKLSCYIPTLIYIFIYIYFFFFKLS